MTAEGDASSLRTMISELHSISARELNAGRKIWYQYWDKHLTFENSHLARLNYVHQNPVHHRLVMQATNYRWCSASWFESKVSRAFAASLRRFRGDRLNVVDDFSPSECGGLPPPSAQSGGRPPHSEGL